MDPPGTAHYLRPAGRTHTPPAVITLDSETRWHDDGPDEVHELRCWHADLDYRRDRRRAGEHHCAEGLDAAAVADLVDEWAGSVETCWLYAHNVAFDLAVTGLAAQLADRGWELSSRFGLGGGVMWCVLHKGRRESPRSDLVNPDGSPVMRVKWAHTLTIADSASLFPKPLAEVAPLTGIAKPDLPEVDDSAEAWAGRCRADTHILRAAVLALMDWWDHADLGPWSVTGAGLGWQTYRRHLDPKQVVIDHDPALLAWERAAVYGGRRDVFRVGQLPPGRYQEIDYEAAYPHVAATQLLPARVAGPVTDHNRREALKGRVHHGMIAEVTICTDTARWPVRANGRVFYPVGKFRTVLAAPDIQAAADAGALVEVGDGWLYCMTRHLRPWAEQVMTWVRDRSSDLARLIAIAAKLWSRAVIGKFAQRGWSTAAWVGPPSDTWSVEEVLQGGAGVRGTVTGLCGRYWLSWADQRGEHERPAVLAFVEAHVRSRLGALIAGPYGPAVIQCDTDGVMVSAAALGQLAAAEGLKWSEGRQVPRGMGDALDAWNRASWPLSMREKTVFKRAVVYGPQHLLLDGRPRMSGVPPGAWETGDGKWAARLWPGLTWQSARGLQSGYVRPVQEYLIVGPYAAGWVLDDGQVRPAEVMIDDDRPAVLLPWELTRWAAAGARLGERQAIWAAGLWEDKPRHDLTSPDP